MNLQLNYQKNWILLNNKFKPKKVLFVENVSKKLFIKKLGIKLNKIQLELGCVTFVELKANLIALIIAINADLIAAKLVIMIFLYIKALILISHAWNAKAQHRYNFRQRKLGIKKLPLVVFVEINYRINVFMFAIKIKFNIASDVSKKNLILGTKHKINCAFCKKSTILKWNLVGFSCDICKTSYNP